MDGTEILHSVEPDHSAQLRPPRSHLPRAGPGLRLTVDGPKALCICERSRSKYSFCYCSHSEVLTLTVSRLSSGAFLGVGNIRSMLTGERVQWLGKPDGAARRSELDCIDPMMLSYDNRC